MLTASPADAGHGEDLNPDKLCHTEENYLASECGALCTALWYSPSPWLYKSKAFHNEFAAHLFARGKLKIGAQSDASKSLSTALDDHGEARGAFHYFK